MCLRLIVLFLEPAASDPYISCIIPRKITPRTHTADRHGCLLSAVLASANGSLRFKVDR